MVEVPNSNALPCCLANSVQYLLTNIVRSWWALFNSLWIASFDSSFVLLHFLFYGHLQAMITWCTVRKRSMKVMQLFCLLNIKIMPCKVYINECNTSIHQSMQCTLIPGCNSHMSNKKGVQFANLKTLAIVSHPPPPSKLYLHTFNFLTVQSVIKKYQY